MANNNDSSPSLDLPDAPLVTVLLSALALDPGDSPGEAITEAVAEELDLLATLITHTSPDVPASTLAPVLELATRRLRAAAVLRHRTARYGPSSGSARSQPRVT